MKCETGSRLKSVAAILIAIGVAGSQAANAYVLNRTIASAGSCPQANAQLSGTGQIDRRWNTALGSNILTSTTGTARTTEVEQVIFESFTSWTGVGTSLNNASLKNLGRVSGPSDCNSTDGVNTICFSQQDPINFSGGVLAFTTSITSDRKNEVWGAKTSSFVGQILDADVLFSPAVSFAAPNVLAANPSAYDMESVLIHELGHTFGLGHSSVLQAMMYPFAPDRGTFKGDRPTPTKPDGPLADDDRAGLRVSYPNPSDPNIGSISGFILAANLPMFLANAPTTSPGRLQTGIFGGHVVAVDSDTGAVVAGILGGWSCDPNNLPTKFDGFYIIEGLQVADSQGNSRRYKVFVEPIDQPTSLNNVSNSLADLCLQNNNPNGACILPTLSTSFTTKIRP